MELYRTNHIQFHPSNGCSIVTNKDFTVIHIDGKPKESVSLLLDFHSKIGEACICLIVKATSCCVFLVRKPSSGLNIWRARLKIDTVTLLLCLVNLVTRIMVVPIPQPPSLA